MGSKERFSLFLWLVLFFISFSYSAVYTWDHSTDVVYVRPTVESGSVRTVVNTGDQKIVIVRGTITFGVESVTLGAAGGDEPYPFPSSLRYEFFLNKPDSNGNNVMVSLSNVLKGKSTTTWDSTSVKDGVYAVSVRLYSSGTTQEEDISRIRARPLIIIVDNDNSPETGNQWLPIVGYEGMRSRNYDGVGVDWIYYKGWSLPNSNTYPYKFVAPPSSDSERQQLVDRSPEDWFTETPWGTLAARYDAISTFSRTEEGHIVVYGTDFYFANGKKEEAVKSFLTDGPRNQGGVMGPTTLVANSRGEGVLGATHGDRIIFAGKNGIFTVAGYVYDENKIPCIVGDCSKSTVMSNKILVGNFENGETFSFSKQSELVFDPQDNNKIYVSDSYNHRIALLEVNGCDENFQNCANGYPKITTFAGKYGVSGYQDGSLSNARFNQPEGMAIIGRKLYVADRGNDAIREIDLDTGQVSTVVKNAFSGGNPYIVRRTSTGDLVVKAGEPIYFLDLDTKSVTYLTDGGKEDRMGLEVDWRGNLGHVDDVFFTGYDGDHSIGRIHIDGTGRKIFVRDHGYPTYYKNSMGGSPTSYALQIAIDDEESKMYATFTYRERPAIIRPRESPDPVNIDKDLSQRGKYVYHYGTVWDFNPHWSRGSLAALHGTVGFSRLGKDVPSFDELSQKTDLELADYIYNGMAGHIKRPEITGKDLQALIYYIRVLSKDGKFNDINPDSIKQNLAGTKYWPDVNDNTPPQISNIQVYDLGNGRYRIDFTTNEEAISVITYGTNEAEIKYKGAPRQTEYYGLYSPIEDDYYTQHSIVIENIPSDIQMKFRVIAKDKAGNVAKSEELLLSPTGTAQSCSDGTLFGYCSTNLPYYCDNGVLIQDCSTCGCSSGYVCQQDGSCVLNQNNNQTQNQTNNQTNNQSNNQSNNQTGNQTQNQTGNYTTNQSNNQSGNYSSNQTQNQTGNYTSNQTNNQSNNQSGNYSSNQTTNQTNNQSNNQTGNQTNNQTNNQTCSDGTPYGQCSSQQPHICSDGLLIDDCGTCGCPSGYVCQQDGSCIESYCNDNDGDGYGEGTSCLGTDCDDSDPNKNTDCNDWWGNFWKGFWNWFNSIFG